VKDTIKMLRELEAAATPGPWYLRVGFLGATQIHGPRQIEVGSAYNGDDQLIVEMRNTIPALLDRLEKLEALVEAARELEQFNAKYIEDTKNHPEWIVGDNSDMESPLVIKIRKALAALEEDV